MPHAKNMPKRSNFNKIYFLYLLFLIIGALLVAEFLIYPLKLKVQRDYFLMGFFANTQKIYGTPINNMGFTGDVLKTNKHPLTIRILTLGGSAFFNRRMTERLKERLQSATSQPIEILGAALRTHTSWSSIYKYKLLSRYKFDYVLIYEGINDLWANRVASKDFKDDYSQLSPWYKRSFFLSHSMIYRSHYNKHLYRKPKAITSSPGYQSIRILKMNLENLIDLVRKDGGVPILMTFVWNIPSNYNFEDFVSNNVGYYNPDNYNKCPVELWGSPEYVRVGLMRINDMIKEVACNKNVLLIDQDNMMSQDISLLGDVRHFNDRGIDQFIDNIVNYFNIHNLLEKKKLDH